MGAGSAPRCPTPFAHGPMSPTKGCSSASVTPPRWQTLLNRLSSANPLASPGAVGLFPGNFHPPPVRGALGRVSECRQRCRDVVLAPPSLETGTRVAASRRARSFRVHRRRADAPRPRLLPRPERPARARAPTRCSAPSRPRRRCRRPSRCCKPRRRRRSARGGAAATSAPRRRRRRGSPALEGRRARLGGTSRDVPRRDPRPTQAGEDRLARFPRRARRSIYPHSSQSGSDASSSDDDDDGDDGSGDSGTSSISEPTETKSGARPSAVGATAPPPSPTPSRHEARGGAGEDGGGVEEAPTFHDDDDDDVREAPQVEAPQIRPPQVEAPQVEAPQVEAPRVATATVNHPAIAINPTRTRACSSRRGRRRRRLSRRSRSRRRERPHQARRRRRAAGAHGGGVRRDAAGVVQDGSVRVRSTGAAGTWWL